MLQNRSPPLMWLFAAGNEPADDRVDAQLILQYLYVLALCAAEFIAWHAGIRFALSLLMKQPSRPGELSWYGVWSMENGECDQLQATLLLPILMVIWDYDQLQRHAGLFGLMVVTSNAEALSVFVPTTFVQAILLLVFGHAAKIAAQATTIRRKNVKKGLTFTIMIVGGSGLGKSTFVNTLCESNVFAKKDYGDPQKAAVEKTVAISPVTVEMEEDGIKLQLTVIDTPGFGDNINNEGHFQDILGYIEKQYDDILAEESRIKRNPKFQDNRVHSLLYFIPPTGHSLREMDIEFMRRLGPRVNVIPVISKSDSMSPQELSMFKKRVMEDIAYYKIPIYNFPYDEEEDDDETIEENNELRALLPFAVVGSEEEVMINGRRVRCRQYPWGVVEVDNSRHCDFSKLRYMLLSSHLQDLKEITHDILYEQYRTEKLSREGDVDPEDLENASAPVNYTPRPSQPSSADQSPQPGSPQ
ncbi:hypothetical protein HK102_008227 [Quaeritorhiza haematococci]|nr:hypothetical protein HK102_008227 [Quaeritorhiza haematococci]